MRHGIVAAALVAIALAGCNQQPATAPTVAEYEQRRAELSSQQAQRVAERRGRTPQAESGDATAGLVTTGAGYSYDSRNKRDPFRSFVDEQKLAKAEHERGPLEQFDLSQLTVVAVVWGTERPRALIEDPSGRGFVVQVGTPIGKNDGLVLGIDDNTVLVQETYVDYLGAQTTKEIEMRVRSTTQGG